MWKAMSAGRLISVSLIAITAWFTFGLDELANSQPIPLGTTERTLQEDAVLAESVKAMMEINTVLGPEDLIEVNARDEVVYLTGSVSTSAEKTAATRDALLAGAKGVVNQLQVRLDPDTFRDSQYSITPFLEDDYSTSSRFYGFGPPSSAIPPVDSG